MVRIFAVIQWAYFFVLFFCRNYAMNETLVVPTAQFSQDHGDLEGMVVMDNSTSSTPGNGSVFAGGPPVFMFRPTGFPRVQTYAYFVIIVVGVFTNSLNLAVLRRMPRKPMFTYLKCLALTDLAFVICVAMLLPYVWNGTLASYMHCFIHCHIVSHLFWVCAKASSSITAALGIERTVATLFPLKTLKLSSTRRVWVIFLIIVVLCLGAQSGLAVMINPTPYKDVYFCVWSPTFFGPLGQTILLVNAIIFEYTVPLILLACNLCLIVTLAVHKARRRSLFASESDPNANQVDHKMNALLIAMSILTLVANTPATLIRLVEIPDSIFSIVRVTSGILYVLDRAANFFLYCLVNDDFRAIAKCILLCSKGSPATGTNCSSKNNSNGKSSAPKTLATELGNQPRKNSSHVAEANHIWDATRINV